MAVDIHCFIFANSEEKKMKILGDDACWVDGQAFAVGSIFLTTMVLHWAFRWMKWTKNQEFVLGIRIWSI